MRCTFIFLPHIPSRSLYCSLASFHLKANILIQPMACNFSLVTRPLSFAVPSSPLPRAVILSQSSCCLRCLLWFICICLVPEQSSWTHGHGAPIVCVVVLFSCLLAAKGEDRQGIGAPVAPASCHWDGLSPCLSPGPKECSRAQVAMAV